MLRLIQNLLIVVLVGGLLVIAVYAISRTIRYATDLIQKEFSEELAWLRTKLPKFPKKKRRKAG